MKDPDPTLGQITAKIVVYFIMELTFFYNWAWSRPPLPLAENGMKQTNSESQVTAHTTEYDCNADSYAFPVIKSYPQFQNCGYTNINMMIK